jgi:oxygen-independent coproporphyrinogen-3 oxidase
MSGIYIHIPFCKQKCTYCDFHFSTSFADYRTKMVQSLRDEIILRSSYLVDSTLTSVYLGGGTPSILNADELQIIFTALHANFQLSKTCEVTLEANPDDITQDNLQHWKSVGINRLSIGLQSFREEDLRWMNRAHSVSDALKCVPLAQEYGFDNISIDLIYGLPNLSAEDWAQHLNTAISMRVQHISAYCLTVEEKTVLKKMVQAKKIQPANEEVQSEQYMELSQTLRKNGFEHYEISNFCLPGKAAVHNSNYWKGKQYLGIGPSAHSFNGTSRRWNIANNQKYMQLIGKNNGWFEQEELTTKDQWNELLLTGLRTSTGTNYAQLSALHPLSEQFTKKVDEFTVNGWLITRDHHLVLTDSGRLLADFIAAELFL